MSEENKTPEESKMPEENKMNSIYVGKKSTMSYCLVAVTVFNKGENECIIRARGRAISKAVDVAEITTRRFLNDIVEIAEIKIGSEEISGEESTKTVSTMDIHLKRK